MGTEPEQPWIHSPLDAVHAPLRRKTGSELIGTDIQAGPVLADWAAIAIENARLYEASERRRRELEQSLRGLEATRDVVIAIGEEISLEHVLEMIVTRGRALAHARSLVIMLREGDDLVLAAGAGHVRDVHGTHTPIAGSTSGHVLRAGRSERIADVTTRPHLSTRELGVADPHAALLVPMIHRGEALGVLAAFDRSDDAAFTEDDEQLLQTFATSAATAVALAQGVRSERLRSSLAAADAERGRWARELHDETLQGLGGLRVLLSSALRRKDPEHTERSLREAVGHIEREIENLRAVITELRPAALDELGLKPAIEALVDRHREHSDFEIDARLELPHPQPGVPRLDAELETTVYRLLQEALTNIAKHARARHVRVAVKQTGEELRIEVRDDGTGFAINAHSAGFGLASMSERASLAGGTLRIASGEQGTLVRAQLPLRVSAAAPLLTHTQA
jgi:signal transduction histidine kinase